MDRKHIIFFSGRINKNNEIESTIETSICLFVYTYCNLKQNICLVDDHDNYTCKVSPNTLKDIKYECLTVNEIEVHVSHLFICC